MRVDDTCESDAQSLPPHRFGQEIVVLCEKNALQGKRSVQEERICQFVGLVFVGREDVNCAEPKSDVIALGT